MAMNFAKGNRSMAFNPTSAFPLDARSYFESYDAAVAAALTAKEAGDSTTTYYFGQNIVVVENGVASFYIIQPDGTLGEVGGKVEINEKVFTKDEDGKLNLFGFAKAVEGAQLVKGANGELTWIKPDTTTVEGLQTAIESLEVAIENTYTKDEVDLAISTAVTNAPHPKRKIVASLQEAENYVANNEDATQYIFMVPTGLQEDDDKYDEYLVIVVGEGEEAVKILEKVGSWEVNLTDYATKEELTALDNRIGFNNPNPELTLCEVIEETYATKEEVSQVTDALNTFESHLGFVTTDDKTVAEVIDETFAKKTDFIIEQVDSSEFTLENKKLGINKIAVEKIDGLTNHLDGKVDKVENKSLIDNSLIAKIDSSLGITSIDENVLSFVDGTLSFSTAFNNRLDGFDTAISDLRTDVDGITDAITWGEIK
jgi:hypothetical protein